MTGIDSLKRLTRWGPQRERRGDRENRMDLGRVTRDLRYLVRGFPIVGLVNRVDETEVGGNFWGRRNVEAPSQ